MEMGQQCLLYILPSEFSRRSRFGSRLDDPDGTRSVRELRSRDTCKSRQFKRPWHTTLLHDRLEGGRDPYSEQHRLGSQESNLDSESSRRYGNVLKFRKCFSRLICLIASKGSSLILTVADSRQKSGGETPNIINVAGECASFLSNVLQ